VGQKSDVSAEQKRGLLDEAASVGPRESVEPPGIPSAVLGNVDQASEPPSAPSDLTGEEAAKPLAAGASLEPAAAPFTAPEREPRAVWLTAATRAALILSLVSSALVLFAQFTFKNDWVIGLLRDNTLPPDRRKTLIISLVAGAVVGGLAGLVLAWVLRRRGHRAAAVERIAWLLTPLGLTPFFSALLKNKAWDEGLPILATTALFTVALEGTLIRALSVVPARMLNAWHRVAAKVPRWLASHGPTALVLIACVAFSLVMSRYAIVKHRSFLSAVFDLGINDNLTYNAYLFEPLRAPIFTGNRPDGPPMLAGHAQFGAYLLVPFYAIRPSAEALLVIQASFVAAAAIPLYFFARRRVSPMVSACIALVYLAQPAVHGATLYEMTFVPIAAVFVLGVAWAVDAGRWIPFLLCLACALSMREDIPVGLCILGIAFVLSGKRFAMGAVLSVVSALYFGVMRFYIMNKAGAWGFPGMMYGELLVPGEPASFGTVVKTLITNPLFVLKKLLIEQKLIYLLHLLVPIALLPLRRPWLLVALLPGAILTLTTTNYGPTVSMGFQYVMHWVPYLFLAVPLALASFRAEPGIGPLKMRAALVAMILATLAITVNFGAFGGNKFRVGFDVYTPSLTLAGKQKYRDLLVLTRQIPPDASVATTQRVGPHVSNRKEAYLTDDLGLQDAEYLVYARDELGTGRNRPLIVEAMKQGTYGLIEISGNFALLKKGYDTRRNQELVNAWALQE
jgi:uncharacterized membrane protein